MPAPKDPKKREEWIEKQRVSHQGKHHSEETIVKISVATIKRWKDSEYRKKCMASIRKRWENPENHEKFIVALNKPELKEKHVHAARKRWQNPEYVKSQRKSKNVKPNKPETLLIQLLQKLFPNQWKYVGNFQIVIDGKCPDFIHVEQKKIIEMFGDYWHGEERTGVPDVQHAQERIDIFAKEGYQTLIIWQHELQYPNLLVEKIIDFHNT